MCKQRHLFKWADECLVDEVEDIKLVMSDMKKDLTDVRAKFERLEKGLEGIKTESEVRCVRNVVVCVLFVGVFCYYSLM